VSHLVEERAPLRQGLQQPGVPDPSGESKNDTTQTNKRKAKMKFAFILLQTVCCIFFKYPLLAMFSNHYFIEAKFTIERKF